MALAVTMKILVDREHVVLYLETSIIFIGSLLCAILYYVAVSVLLSGSPDTFFKANDIPDILLFSAAITTVAIVLRRVRDGRSRYLLAGGFALESFIIIIVITINRYLSVFPASGAQIGYLLVATLGVCAYVLIPIGLLSLVKSTNP